MPELLCSRCSKRLRVGEEYQGKRIRCKCGELVDVPVASPMESKPYRASSARMNRMNLLMSCLGVALGLALFIIGFMLGRVTANNGTTSNAASTGATSTEVAPAVVIKKDAIDKVWLRDDFRNAIMGLDQNEVIAAVGKPDSTKDSGHDLYWFYYSKTKDPITDKIDGHAMVIFQRGVVVRVNY